MTDSPATSPKFDASAFRPFLRVPILSKEQIESLRLGESSRQRGISPAVTFAYVIHRLEGFAVYNNRKRDSAGVIDVSQEVFRESAVTVAKALGADRRTIVAHISTLVDANLLRDAGRDMFLIRQVAITELGETMRRTAFVPIPLAMFDRQNLSFLDLLVYGCVLKHSGLSSDDTSKHGACRLGAMKIGKEVRPDCEALTPHVTQSLAKLVNMGLLARERIADSQRMNTVPLPPKLVPSMQGYTEGTSSVHVSTSSVHAEPIPSTHTELVPSMQQPVPSDPVRHTESNSLPKPEANPTHTPPSSAGGGSPVLKENTSNANGNQPQPLSDQHAPTNANTANHPQHAEHLQTLQAYKSIAWRSPFSFVNRKTFEVEQTDENVLRVIELVARERKHPAIPQDSAAAVELALAQMRKDIANDPDARHPIGLLKHKIAARFGQPFADLLLDKKHALRAEVKEHWQQFAEFVHARRIEIGEFSVVECSTCSVKHVNRFHKHDKRWESHDRFVFKTENGKSVPVCPSCLEESENRLFAWEVQNEPASFDCPLPAEFTSAETREPTVL